MASSTRPDGPGLTFDLDPRPGRMHATSARLAAVGTAMLLVVFMVLSVSRAAFTTTTDSLSNDVTAGTLSLLDDDLGSALFDTLTGLLPLVPVVNCIHVDYAGSIDPAAVQLYSAASSGLLDSYLNFKVEIGPDNADAFGTCTNFTPSSTLYDGTLADFTSTYDSYANGLSAWDPSGPDARTFRVTLTVQDLPAAIGLNAAFGLTWETRSS